jgi:mono/diheme cytochrome c family protein
MVRGHMVGVVIIAVVFTGISVAIFYGSARGGLGRFTDLMFTQSAIGRRVINTLLIVTYIGFGVVVPAVFLVGNHDKASAQIGGMKLTAAEKAGRELFGEHCAVCHTLAAAAAIGKTGPNLDQLRPAFSLVMHTIQNGCLQSAPAGSPQSCLGYGTMPADVVQGRQAEQVAAFVSKVAGHE